MYIGLTYRSQGRHAVSAREVAESLTRYIRSFWSACVMMPSTPVPVRCTTACFHIQGACWTHFLRTLCGVPVFVRLRASWFETFSSACRCGMWAKPKGCGLHYYANSTVASWLRSPSPPYPGPAVPVSIVKRNVYCSSALLHFISCAIRRAVLQNYLQLHALPLAACIAGCVSIQLPYCKGA